MVQSRMHASYWVRALLGLVVLTGLPLLIACASAPPAPQIPINTDTPSPSTNLPGELTKRFPVVVQERSDSYPAPEDGTPRPMATPTPTKTGTRRWGACQTLLPMNLEHYGLKFDAKAKPQIPIQKSVAMSIWGTAIPATPVEGLPQFINHPIPTGLAPVDPRLLSKAGCSMPECPIDDRLKVFGCKYIDYFDYFGHIQPQPGLSLVAACLMETEDLKNPSADSLFLIGCPTGRKVGYIFKSGDEFMLVNNQQDLRKRFAPIESASEAITYAQLTTGLKASFQLTLEPYRLYLQKTIEDTQAVKTLFGYRVNLYHRPQCLCQPTESEVIIQVGWDGSITWISAKPFSIYSCLSCTD